MSSSAIIISFIWCALTLTLTQTFGPPLPFGPHMAHHMYNKLHMAPRFPIAFPLPPPLQARSVLFQHRIPQPMFSGRRFGTAMPQKVGLQHGSMTGTAAGVQAKVVPVSKKQSMLPGQGTPVKSTVAERVLQDLDQKVDPCVDFHQYACGGYLQKQAIPNGWHSKFFDPKAKVTQVLIDMLSVPPHPSDAMPFLNAKTFYRSCMNEGMIAARGTFELRNLINHLGGWPILGQWSAMTFNLEHVLAKSRPYMGPENTAVIGVTIKRHIKQFGQFTLFVDQPKLGQSHLFSSFVTPDLYLLPRNSVYAVSYEQYIADIATNLGAPRIMAEMHAKEIVDFEIKLARIMLPAEEHRKADLRYKKISIYELHLRYPQFHWLRYLRQIAAPANVYISARDTLVLWDNLYYDKLFKLLRLFPTRTVANYIIWRTIQPLLATQGTQFQLQRLRFDAVSNGAQNATLGPRDQYCAQIVDAQMSWVTGRLFIDRHPTANLKINKVRDIAAYVRFMLIKFIKEAVWLSKETQLVAIQKVMATSLELGYPGYVMDNLFLHTYYKPFQMKEFSFFWNMKNSLVQNYIHSLRQLMMPHPGRWDLSPTTVGAQYKLDRNAIELPLALMDEPVYSNSYAPAMNFGGMGSGIGMLYAHAIDLTGKLYTAEGMLQNTWSNTSVGNLNMKAQCLMNQFAVPATPKPVSQFASPAKTLNKNTIDLIGIKAGYYAYKLWSARTKTVSKVPGLPFTGDQLYFINIGRWMCDKQSPEVAGKWEMIDVYPLFRRRLMAQMRNLPEFSAAFQCSVGSPMNPVEKCHIF